MPLVSKKQTRWMFATHPEMAKRWAAHTPSIKALPESAGGESETETKPPAKKRAELLKLAELTRDPDVIARVSTA